MEELADSCTIILQKSLGENRKVITCRHICDKGDSYYVELADFNGKGNYSRSGVSIWYYDNDFAKIRKRSTFWRGIEYGMVQEFYENGLIKFEGICKTIRYFPKYTNDKDKGVMCKVDLVDTIFLPNTRFIKDSIDGLGKYCYFDTLYNPSNMLSKGPAYPTLSQKFGEWKYYDAVGKLTRREYYTKGILIQTIKY